mgnify:CR=1 FL=1
MVDESGEPHEATPIHELGFVRLLDVMGNDACMFATAFNISFSEGLSAICSS